MCLRDWVAVCYSLQIIILFFINKLYKYNDLLSCTTDDIYRCHVPFSSQFYGHALDVTSVVSHEIKTWHKLKTNIHNLKTRRVTSLNQ
jgi:hypothetical protein